MIAQSDAAMDPQVSVLLAQDAPIVNTMNNNTNKRKHEEEWEDLTKSSTIVSFGSMPEQKNLSDAANLPLAGAAASPTPRKAHRRQTLTAAPSLATEELLPLLLDTENTTTLDTPGFILPESIVNTPSIPDNAMLQVAELDRCDSITSACSALAISHTTSNASFDMISAGSSCWNDLPDDVLRRVLDNLPFYSLRIVRSVCKGWWQASNRTLRFARPDHLSASCSSSGSCIINSSSNATSSSTTEDSTTLINSRALPSPPLPRYVLSISFPNLRILDLSCCNSVLEMISPQELGFQSQLQDQSLSQLAGLVYLKELILRGCGKITGPGLSHLAVLPALEHVDLTGCTGLTDAGLANGLSGLAHVPALTFLKCTGLTNAAVSLLTALPKLERVAVPPRTTDDGLRTLATAAPGLQRVAIRGCHNVGPDGIAALLTAPNLKRVVVSRCPKVTAAALGKVTVNVSVVSCAQAYPGPIIAASTMLHGGNGGVTGSNADAGPSEGGEQQGNAAGGVVQGINYGAPQNTNTNTALSTVALPHSTANICTTTVNPASLRFGSARTPMNRNLDSVAAVVAPGAAPDLQLMIATFHN